MLETKYPAKRSIIFIVGFLVTAPAVILFTLISLFSLSSSIPQGRVLAAESVHTRRPSSQKIEGFPTVSVELRSEDARVEIIRQYLSRYSSPLVDYADLIVEEADKNELDFRLITAIAQQESNLCKKIPENTYNCWGWGVHSSGTLGFGSFEEGVKKVTAGLRNNYVNNGFQTVEEIMSRYTPHSPNGAWAKGVRSFMQEMQ